jgi:hypothetical protein
VTRRGAWHVDQTGGGYTAVCPHGVGMPDEWPDPFRADRDTEGGCPCDDQPDVVHNRCTAALTEGEQR